MNEYVPKMTPGRELYERWLAAQDISPDDLWDHIQPTERDAWEGLATRSQGLEEKAQAFLDAYVESDLMIPTDDVEALDVAEVELRECLSLGLPDEEGRQDRHELDTYVSTHENDVKY